MIRYQLSKTIVLATINNKVLIKQEKNGKITRLYLSQEEAFKLAYKLMSIASEL